MGVNGVCSDDQIKFFYSKWELCESNHTQKKKTPPPSPPLAAMRGTAFALALLVLASPTSAQDDCPATTCNGDKALLAGYVLVAYNAILGINIAENTLSPFFKDM